MGTHALIGYTQGSTVRYTYCHYDGYLEWLGLHLFNGFTDQNLIAGLVEGGDIRTIDPSDDGSGYSVDYFNDSDPTRERPLQDFTLSETGYEWLYLWDGSSWWCLSHYLPIPMMKLSDALKLRGKAQ